MTFNLGPSSFGMAISGFSTLPSVALYHCVTAHAPTGAETSSPADVGAPGTRRLARRNAACGAGNNVWNPECSVRGHRLQCPLDVDSGRLASTPPCWCTLRHSHYQRNPRWGGFEGRIRQDRCLPASPPKCGPILALPADDDLSLLGYFGVAKAAPGPSHWVWR